MATMLFILYSIFIGCALAEPLKWDQISVTFRKYSPLPMHEYEAVAKGWKLIADNCKDTSTPFKGRRYMLGTEHATIPIYDINGRLAGLQMAFKTSLKKGSYGRYVNAMKVVKEAGGDYYYMTSYFTDAKNICDKSAKKEQKLVFLLDTDKYIEVPSLEKDIVATKWVKGKCFVGMGQHYWYDISQDLSCDDLFPAFLLYNTKGQLFGWGFVSDANVPGKRVEHPPSWILGYFFDKKTEPKCLRKLDHRSTQHVYMTPVGWTSHLCPLWG